MTTDIYQQNPRQYFDSTVNIDPTSFLSPLAALLPPGAHILDIGCGSGRDLKWFQDRGHHATGLERSHGLATLAREHSGCNVIPGDFETFDFSAIQVDAMVLVGALVHVARERLRPVLKRILQGLVPGGHMLLTLKQGAGVREHADGRVFTLWEDGEVRGVFDGLGVQVEDFRVQRSGVREEDVWLGYVVSKE